MHIGLPRVGVDADGEVCSLPHWLSPAQLRRLWAVWAALIKGVWASCGFDVSRWTFDPAAKNPMATWPKFARVNGPQWSYRDPGTKLEHRWRYDRRPWPAWEAAAPKPGLLSPLWYGCAATRKGLGAVHWRRAVTGDLVVPEAAVCKDCGEEYACKDVVGIGGAGWQRWSIAIVGWRHETPDHVLVPTPRGPRPRGSDPPADGWTAQRDDGGHGVDF